MRVLEPAGNPANSHTDVHGASAQSGGTSHPIVSTPSPGRPFGNLDRNPQSHSSLIPGVSSPFRSPTPIAPQTAARQHEGSGSSYVEGVGSRTAPMLGSPTHNGYESRSLAQPGRAWYHTSTNTSSRTLSTNEDSVSWSDNLFGGEMDGLSSRDWYTTEIEVRFRHTSQNMISGLINQVRNPIHYLKVFRFLNIVSFILFRSASSEKCLVKALPFSCDLMAESSPLPAICWSPSFPFASTVSRSFMEMYAEEKLAICLK